MFASCDVFPFGTPGGTNSETQPGNETHPSDQPSDSLPKVEKWIAYEIDFTSDKKYTDPVCTCDMDVVFTNVETGTTFTQPAFWCGGNQWKVRVALTELGEWSYLTKCTDTDNAGLHGLTGGINCVPYSGDLAIYKHGFFKNMKNGTYDMIWFNCRTGEQTVQEVIVEDGSFAIPNKPDGNDWTVVLQYKN